MRELGLVTGTRMATEQRRIDRGAIHWVCSPRQMAAVAGECSALWSGRRNAE